MCDLPLCGVSYQDCLFCLLIGQAVVTCNSDLSPEEPLSVFFTVSTNGMGGHITIQATNDRGFTSSFPTSLLLEAGTSAKGTALFTASTNTPMGSDVTLIVEVTAQGAADPNYVVLRLSSAAERLLGLSSALGLTAVACLIMDYS